MTSEQDREDPNAPFKFGHQRFIQVIINENWIVYAGKLCKIGLTNEKCICNAYELKIRDTFLCKDCLVLHSYKCSHMDTATLIANNYFCGSSEDRTICYSCHEDNNQNWTMISKIIISLIVLIGLILAINAEDEAMNELFCQLNEYAKLRAINNLNVFPCKR